MRNEKSKTNMIKKNTLKIIEIGIGLGFSRVNCSYASGDPCAQKLFTVLA